MFILLLLLTYTNITSTCITDWIIFCNPMLPDHRSVGIDMYLWVETIFQNNNVINKYLFIHSEWGLPILPL